MPFSADGLKMFPGSKYCPECRNPFLTRTSWGFLVEKLRFSLLCWPISYNYDNHDDDNDVDNDDDDDDDDDHHHDHHRHHHHHHHHHHCKR